MAPSSTLARFVINGGIATLAHYFVLVLLIDMAGLQTAALANSLAAIVGISISYIGNRLHVFRSKAPLTQTLPRFLLVYGLQLVIHATVLGLWTDVLRLPYQSGFLLATGLGITLTYLANKLFVFRTT